MYIEQDKLLKDLTIILQFYNAKKKIKEKIIKKFQEYGFLYGAANAIISGTNPLMQLQDELIWLLVIILHETVEDEFKSKVDPDKILTEIEIQKAKNIKSSTEDEVDIYPVVIDKTNMDEENDYSTTFDIRVIAEYFDKRIFKYNYETQRPRISKWYSGIEVKEIHLNEKNKKQITNNILNGTQIPDEITLNILQNGQEELVYDSAKRVLNVISGDISVIDGWHRICAARNAYKINPKVKFYLKVRIVHWDLERAKAFIHQKSLGTLLDPLAKKSYDVYNYANQVVKKLNENPKSCIRGKITTDNLDLNSKKALVMFNTLFDTINSVFDIKSNKDMVQITNYLKDGINIIADNDISILDEIKDDRVWVAYLLILEKYYKEDDWQDKVIEAIGRINEEELMEIPYKVVNVPFIKKVKDYINGKVAIINV